MHACFDAIASELLESSEMMDELAEQVRKKSLPDSYYNNPLVKNSPPATILPLGLYADGVKYQARDTTVGFWAINLITGRRHLLAALPKREFCLCRCRGQCSIHPVLVFLERVFLPAPVELFQLPGTTAHLGGLRIPIVQAHP